MWLEQSRGGGMTKMQGERLMSWAQDFKFYIFIYFWLRWVFVAARGLFSGCGEWGLPFLVVRGLTAVASLVVKHGL